MHVRVSVHCLHNIDIAGLFHLMGVSIQSPVLAEDVDRAGAKIKTRLCLSI